MTSLTQRDILFVFIGGLCGIGAMWALFTYTSLGELRLDTMSMHEAELIDHGDLSMGRHQAPSDDSMPGMQDASMTAMMHDMNASLVGKTGDALDKEFLTQMIVHHQGAVEMAQTLLAGTKRPELVKMGNDIVSVQTKEINQMKQWLNDWFGSAE